ncbi:hypothetical protein QCA50_011432 [Cerrena zonata]|uniref:RNI-like protein n=1 Tax=Cerrena zonata TaxID=2478898 RepID=A0AAW0G367_9APHY
MTPLPSKAPNSVSLSSRKHVSFSAEGLSSVEGARTVIETIESRKQVTKLSLSHNDLADEGCIELFSYLCSPEGRKHQLTEINLVHNHLGDRSLLAISEYLRNNRQLKELWLQANAFSGARDVVATFVDAVNSSQLRTLTLSSNCGDGNVLVSHLMDMLDSTTLGDIQISGADLTQVVIPHIVNYISSPRSRLHTIRANGNKLGIRGVREIVQAVERHNYSLTKVDLLANWTEGSETESDEDHTMEARKRVTERLNIALKRNDRLKKETTKGAFALLRHARAVLLRTAVVHPAVQQTDSPTPISRLPMELQLHILSFIAPTLSTTQRLRIFHFAATPLTLPRLSLTPTADAGCIPDPASVSPVGPAAFGGFNMAAVTKAGHSGCPSGKCMGSGSLMCRREAERLKWLEEMGCDSYEHEP